MNKFRAITSIIKQLSYILDKKQKQMAVGVFVCITIGSAFELLGVSAIYPFIQSLLAPQELREEWYIKIVADALSLESDKSLMLMLGIAVIMLYLIKNAYMLIMTYVQYNYGATVQRQLSTKLLRSCYIPPISRLL